MENKIVEKAFFVFHPGMIGYGPEIANSIDETEVVYGKTASNAKSNATEWKNWEIVEGVPPKYTDLKCRRAQLYDKISYKDRIIKRKEFEYEKSKEKHNDKLNQILLDETIKYCYIYKRGSYYMPNYCGYTSFIHQAGVYEKKKAVRHAMNIIEIILEPINIEKHNELINGEIHKLEEKLIKN